MRKLRTLAVVLLASLGAVVGQDKASSSQEGAESAEKKKELWELVYRAFSENQFVSFRVEVLAAPYKGVIESEMAEGKVKSVIWSDGKWLATIVVKDGRIYEYRAEWQPFEDKPEYRLKNVCLSYEAYLPDGTDMALLADKRDCLFGNYIQSWVGKKSYFLDFFRRRIEQSNLLPDENLGGQKCRVLLWEQERPYRRQDKFYFNAATGFLVKWDTQSEDSNGEMLLRTRDFLQVKAGEIPAGHKWEFSLPESQTCSVGLEPASQPVFGVKNH